jgi:hypothetical protein
METIKSVPPAHPVELAILAALVTGRALLVVLAALVALVLTLVGWQPPAAAAPVVVPVAPVVAAAAAVVLAPTIAPAGAIAAQLDSLNVANLRALARSRGLRSLARNGRRAELLAALVEV